MSSGVYTAPSLYLWSPVLAPDPQHTPRDGGEAQDESRPVPPLHPGLAQGVLCHPGATHSGQGPGSITGSAEGRGASLPPKPQTQARKGPKRNRSRQLEVRPALRPRPGGPRPSARMF